MSHVARIDERFRSPHLKSNIVSHTHMSAVMAFIEDCIDAGDKIRNGYLYSEEFPEVYHVHRSSWPYLGEINERGFLTWQSQDAMSMKSSKAVLGERAYVCGKMLHAQGKKFVTAFNLQNEDKFATLTVPIARLSGLIDQGRYLGITNREFDKEKQEWKTRGVMPAIDDSRMYTDDSVHLLGIQVIDLVWGRRATSSSGLWKAILEVLPEMIVTQDKSQ